MSRLNIFLSLPLIISILYSYSVFNSEDWYVIRNLSSINAITEDYNSIHFASKNGIFSYDKASEEFYYNTFLSHGVDNSLIFHFYYDIYSDYYWLIQKGKISIRSSLSDYWREVSTSDLGLFSIYDITDIGSSESYIWIKSSMDYFPVNPISGLRIKENINTDEIETIIWGNSRYGKSGTNIDITSYTTFSDWIIGNNYLFHSKKGKVRPTVKMKDWLGNIWFGTDNQLILKGWENSSRLEVMKFGVHSANISEIYYDNQNNWWFGENSFFKSNKLKSNLLFSNNIDFLSRWNEDDNDWDYYHSNLVSSGINMDVNHILRVGQFLYICTMKGLIIIDLFDDIARVVSTGFLDNALWDIVNYDQSIFIATSKGLNEFSIISNSIITNEIDIIKGLNGYEVYDLLIDNNLMYIASEIGTFQVDLDTGIGQMISSKSFNKIDISKHKLIGLNNNLWSINLSSKEDELLYTKVSDFSISGNYMWLNYNSYTNLINISTDESWEYSFEDGIPGNLIYKIDCDKDWVWFLTNDGIGFYNWSRYHYE